MQEAGAGRPPAPRPPELVEAGDLLIREGDLDVVLSVAHSGPASPPSIPQRWSAPAQARRVAGTRESRSLFGAESYSDWFSSARAREQLAVFGSAPHSIRPSPCAIRFAFALLEGMRLPIHTFGYDVAVHTFRYFPTGRGGWEVVEGRPSARPPRKWPVPPRGPLPLFWGGDLPPGCGSRPLTASRRAP
jgi:hypothetical protein